MWPHGHTSSFLSPRSAHLIHDRPDGGGPAVSFASRLPSGHAKRHFHQVGPAHRQWTRSSSDKPANSIIPAPKHPAPFARRHRGHADQQQPGHHHDRSGHGGQRVPVAAHHREHREDPAEAQDRRGAAHHGRTDRPEPRHRMREARHLEGAQCAHDRGGHRGDRHHREPRALPRADGEDRCAHGAEQDRHQLPRRQESGAGVRLPAGDPRELHARWCRCCLRARTRPSSTSC